MNIHTVARGESLWTISRRYNIPVQSIAASNALTSPYRLVVGQSLVIPQAAQRHTVRAGETLFTIARQYDVPSDYLADVNTIPPSGVLYPGQVLIIPAQSNRFGTLEVNAYAEPTGNPQADLRAFEEAAGYLTYLSLFSYRVTEAGELIPPPDVGPLLTAARQRGIAPLMVITNFRDGTFDSELADVILRNNEIQENLINNILETLRTQNYYGINIDFERVPPRDRDLYTTFVRRVGDRIRPEGYSLSVALAPKVSAEQVGAWYEAHDYGGLGTVADFVIIMTYEWGWSGGPPLAVAPINQVRRVLDYAVSVIPRNKIIMGMPLYGYDWTLPYRPGGPFARRVSPVQAVQRAVQYNARIDYDQTAQSPSFTYYDEDGTQHIVWFEDPRSVLAKFRLADNYGLRGVSYWVLGSSFPQNWIILEDLFQIRRV